MTEVTVISLGKDAITTVLLVALPSIRIWYVSGLIVSIFQATTQIQEQTLTFIPKIIAVLVSFDSFNSLDTMSFN